MKLQERLRAVESSSDELGGEIGTNSYRNPDGPEAAAQLDLYEAALREIEEIVSAWAFAHDIDGAARNDLFARLRARLNSTDTGA